MPQIVTSVLLSRKRDTFPPQKGRPQPTIINIGFDGGFDGGRFDIGDREVGFVDV